jgi:hypothetical protein
LKRYLLPRLDCTTHTSNSYHMLHTKWFFRMWMHSKLGMNASAILASGWWENHEQFKWTCMSDRKFPKSSDFICTSCATGKLILRPSHLKMQAEPLKFLERIQGDICGPIQPLSGPFRNYMVLIDASIRWSHVCLLSTRNHAFAKLIAQVIRLRASHPEH